MVNGKVCGQEMKGRVIFQSDILEDPDEISGIVKGQEI